MVTITGNAVHLELGKDSYDVVIGDNLSFQAARELKALNYGFKYAIITDSNVKSLYADRLEKDLRNVGLEAYVFDFPAG